MNNTRLYAYTGTDHADNRPVALRFAQMEANCAAFGVAYAYGKLSFDEQAALPEHFRKQLDDLALRLAQYHSVRDGEGTV